MAERGKIIGLSLGGALVGAVLLVPLTSFIARHLSARQQNIHHLNEIGVLEIMAVILAGAGLGAAALVAIMLRDDADAATAGRICQYGGGLAALIAGLWSLNRLFSDVFNSYRDAFGVIVVVGIPLLGGILLFIWGFILRQQGD
ncbi:MAG TPA: hypothetical protein VNA16_07855 [Abditibacteriaceae bacterium]|nr:hypothetical protein [Abditibacteriaceae bacterium]